MGGDGWIARAAGAVRRALGFAPRERAPELTSLLRSGGWGAVARRLSPYLTEQFGPCTPDHVAPWVLKIMREDPQLVLGLGAIKAPFFGVEYHFRGGRPEVRSFVERTLGWSSPLFPKLLSTILLAFEFGYQSAELEWAIRDVEVDPDGAGEPPRVLPRRYVLEDLNDLDPERVLDVQVRGNGIFDGVHVEGAFLPAEKCLHVAYQGEWRNHLGRAGLKPAYPHWFGENWFRKWASSYTEHKGEPSILAYGPGTPVYDPTKSRADQPAPKTGLDLLGEQAASLRNGGIAALPSARDSAGHLLYEMRLLEDSGRVDQFLPLIHEFQAMKLRALGIPERALIQDTATGSFAMASEHVDAFLAGLQRQQVTMVLPAFNSLATRLVSANFGRAAAVPVCEAAPLSRSKQALVAELLGKVLMTKLPGPDGKTYTPAQTMDFRKILEQLNVPLLSADALSELLKASPAEPSKAEASGAPSGSVTPHS